MQGGTQEEAPRGKRRVRRVLQEVRGEMEGKSGFRPSTSKIKKNHRPAHSGLSPSGLKYFFLQKKANVPNMII